MRILIAEDEGAIRMDLSEIVRENGHEVVAAVCDGRSALEATLRDKPDLAFLDISMPEMTGLEVAAALRDEGDGLPLCPVVIVTAYADASSTEAAAAAGVYGYIVKPFTDADLISIIPIALSRYHTEADLRKDAATLQDRLDARKIIERAKGILMSRGLSEERAYELMRAKAMETRQPLVDLAQALITSAEVLKD